MRSGRSNRRLVIALWVIMMFLFLYGVVTVQYKIFPFNQLKAIKQLVSPTSKTSSLDYFYHKKSSSEGQGRHQYDVVFIGDSITNRAEWGVLFPSQNIANLGLDGESTDGVLKRMDSIYATNARKAFIMIGINDFLDGAEVNDVIENYRKIINELVAQGIQTYVQSTILAGHRNARLNKKIMALNDQLKKIANEKKSFTYIDLNASLAKGLVLDSKYSPDDIHLNGSGYAVWKDVIKGYIQ